MPSYFDPILQETTTFDHSTIVYLINLEKNVYAIKAISSNIDKLAHDPTGLERNYWLLNTQKLLQKTSQNKETFNLIFPQEQLTTAPLSTEQLITHLMFFPTADSVRTFTMDFFPEPEQRRRPRRNALTPDQISSILFFTPLQTSPQRSIPTTESLCCNLL